VDKQTQNLLLIGGGVAVVLYLMSKNSASASGPPIPTLCEIGQQQACAEAQGNALSQALQSAICSF
jgi:hypothetical protein